MGHGFTRSQELAFLAVASGLRYTSSMSISYPRAIINDIVAFKQGFTIRTATGGLEVMTQGWEMSALRTLRAAQLTIMHRMVCVLLLKLALQMNLQIDFFIIKRARNHPGESFYRQFYRQLLAGELEGSDMVEVASILGLLVTVACEFTDGWLLLEVFWSLRKKVLPSVSEVKTPLCWLLLHMFQKLGRRVCGIEEKHDREDHYAYEDLEDQPRNRYTGKDLKAFYYKVCWNMMAMVVLQLISLFLIMYGVLKFIMSAGCDDNLWQFHDSCLKEMPQGWSCEV